MRALIFGIVYVFLQQSLVVSQEEPANKSATKESIDVTLRGLKERLPSSNVEWKVAREIFADNERAKQISIILEKQIDAAKDDELKKKLIFQRDEMLSKARNGEKIPMTVSLSIENRNKFRVDQVFDYKDVKVFYEYYANNDGVIYAVNTTGRRVRLLSPDKADILSELGRGVPGFGCAQYLEGIEDVRMLRKRGNILLLRGSVPKFSRSVHIEFDSEKYQITTLRAFERSGSKVFEAIMSNIVLKNGYPIPSKSTYRMFTGGKLAMEEVWELKSFHRVKEVRELKSSKYSPQAGYAVRDMLGK